MNLLFWAGEIEEPLKDKQPPRPQGDEGEFLIVQNPKARVTKRGGEIVVVLERDTVSRHPIEQLDSVLLYGAVQISTQALHSLLERNIPIAHFSPAGRYIGSTSGLPGTGIDARMGQYRLWGEDGIRLKLAKEVLRAKIHNQRVMLMRNGDVPEDILKQFARLRNNTTDAEDMDQLRGMEGMAAALYFGHFSTMLKGTAFENFDFKGRNRRPPRDPVNALLSQGYSILVKELAGICHVVGLDPFLGFLHQPRYGRPALALDLMEEFRPLIADSVAISLLNRKELGTSDFVQSSRGAFLKPSGRKQFWEAWFRRMDSEVKHPQFDYRMSYRRMLVVQVRQLWRFLRGEAKTYYGFTTR